MTEPTHRDIHSTSNKGGTVQTAASSDHCLWNQLGDLVLGHLREERELEGHALGLVRINPRPPGLLRSAARCQMMCVAGPDEVTSCRRATHPARDAESSDFTSHCEAVNRGAGRSWRPPRCAFHEAAATCLLLQQAYELIRDESLLRNC